MAKNEVRLQKYIARCGITSRRKAEQLILDGRVSVNGIIITALGMKVRAGVDKVLVDGKKAVPEQMLEYFLLNKPKGYVTSRFDPQGRPVVISLIRENNTRIFPVGRLDFDTEGALLLTNDGELAQKIQHPSFQVKKTYEAVVYGHPGQAKLRKLAGGIMLDKRKTAPAKINIVKKWPKTSLIKCTIHEGRRHQVKNMFKAIGHPVASLKRTAYGQLLLGSLALGASRRLPPSEIKKIFL